MKSRNSYSPILCALVLSLALGPVRTTTAASPSAFAPAPVSATPEPVAGVTAKPVANPPTVAKNTAPYTVVAGDSLTSLANKFNTTRKKLKALNNLTVTKLTPGQILQVPARKSSKTTAVASAKASKPAKPHHALLVAQPVQDFDIPASTFASCPVPVPSDDDETPSPTPVVAQTPETEEPAPILSPSAPADLREQLEAQKLAAQNHLSATPQIQDNEIVASPATKHSSAQITSSSANPFADDDSVSTPAPTPPAPATAKSTSSPAPFTPPNQRFAIRGINPALSNSTSMPETATDDWGCKFIQQARLLGDQGIDYDDDWRPPGEPHSWAMDCSNTSRYLYKVTTGISLPRTASDQYYYLHLQGKAWDVPQTATGFADGDFLRRNLKPGDLLFWENTYRPERQPPITHVMVFLGTNDKGQWIMAGSQSSRGGEHNRRNGGPDIYVFRPSQPCGGYTTWLGLVRHQGRFCAFGRPLEADPSKLSMAENN